MDGDIVVVNSPDIVAYLEHRYPQMPVYPEEQAARVHARAGSGYLIHSSIRFSSTSRIGNGPSGRTRCRKACSKRPADLRNVYDALDKELADREFVSGILSVADIGLFPDLASAKAMEVEFSADAYPHLARWFKRMRALSICAADLRRTRDYVVNLKERDFERRRIFWRGDRIEWLLARGFHAWFFDEIMEDRVGWPGPPMPAPLQRGAADDGRSAQRA